MFAVRCRYPDGTLVDYAALVETRDGLIVRQDALQAWDEG